jgi:hypothetical protein
VNTVVELPGMGNFMKAEGRFIRCMLKIASIDKIMKEEVLRELALKVLHWETKRDSYSMLETRWEEVNWNI